MIITHADAENVRRAEKLARVYHLLWAGELSCHSNRGYSCTIAPSRGYRTRETSMGGV
jgi:hypothetical protein